ncbi:unannotated protein [freshwater metagenome]|uniref:Unannotated protein n=1 Tax=freshwater metagenome TaxID=449393 RepID=A0A6J6D003_9ZZZZ
MHQNVTVADDRKDVDWFVGIGARQTWLRYRQPRFVLEVGTIETHQSEEATQVDWTREGVNVGRIEIEFFTQKLENLLRNV